MGRSLIVRCLVDKQVSITPFFLHKGELNFAPYYPTLNFDPLEIFSICLKNGLLLLFNFFFFRVGNKSA